MNDQATPKEFERRQKKALTLKVLLLIFLTNVFTALWLLPPSSSKKNTKLPKDHVMLEIRAENFASLSEKRPLKIHIFNSNFSLIAREALLFRQKGKSRWKRGKGTFVVAVKEKDVGKLAQTENPRLYPFSKNIPAKQQTSKKEPQVKKEPHVYQIVF